MPIDKDLKEQGRSIEYLMSRFAVRRSTWLARAIVNHLETIAGTPDHQQYQQYKLLLPIWNEIADDMENKERPVAHGWKLNLLQISRKQLVA